MQRSLFTGTADSSFVPDPRYEETERDRILQVFEETQGEWLTKIRAVAWRLFKKYQRPISADDLRTVMLTSPRLEPPGENRNVMGAVFRKGWDVVGMIHSTTEGSHGRRILTYVPEDVRWSAFHGDGSR